MATFKSSFFSDENYKYTTNVLERMYKDLKANPTFVLAVCEKTGELNSPATVKLDTEVDNSIKRGWELTATTNLEKVCEKYLDYKPESITCYSLSPDSLRVMLATDYTTKEVTTYNY